MFICKQGFGMSPVHLLHHGHVHLLLDLRFGRVDDLGSSP